MNQLPHLETGKKPSKKLFAILTTAFLAVLGVVGYISLAGDAHDAPPYLEMDTSSLMQGKLSKLKGFAELKTSDKYSCVGKSEAMLAGNVNNVFSTRPITFEEVANSLKFNKKDGQYLIAFFSPGDDKAGKGFDEEGWYFYPTSDSPYKTGGYAEFNIKNDEGAKYTIPAYRGFQIVVNNSETKICSDNLKLATDKEIFAQLSEGDSFMKLLYEEMKYWPEGWIMMPFGKEVAVVLSDKDYASELDFDISSVFMQTDRSTFKKEFTAEDKNDYLMFWVKMGKAFDWEKFWNDLKDDEPTDGYGDNGDGNDGIDVDEELSCTESNFENGILTLDCTQRVRHYSNREKAQFTFTINGSSSVSFVPQIDDTKLTFVIYPNETGYGVYSFKDVSNLVDANGNIVNKSVIKIDDLNFVKPDTEVFCFDDDGTAREVGYTFTYTKGDVSFKEVCLPSGEWAAETLGSPIMLIGKEIEAKVEDVYAFPLIAGEKYGLETDKYSGNSLVLVKFNYSNDLLRSIVGYYMVKGEGAFYNSLSLNFGNYVLHPVDSELCPGGLEQCSDSFVIVFAFSDESLEEDFVLNYDDVSLVITNMKMQDDSGSLYNINGEYSVGFNDLDYVSSSHEPTPMVVSGNEYVNDYSFDLIFDQNINTNISKNDIVVWKKTVEEGEDISLSEFLPVGIEVVEVKGNKLSVELAEDPLEDRSYKVDFLSTFKSVDGAMVRDSYEFFLPADLQAVQAFIDLNYSTKDTTYIYVLFNKLINTGYIVNYPRDAGLYGDFQINDNVETCVENQKPNVPCIYQFFSTDTPQPYYSNDIVGKAIRVGIKNLGIQDAEWLDGASITVTKNIEDRSSNLIDSDGITTTISGA